MFQLRGRVYAYCASHCRFSCYLFIYLLTITSANKAEVVWSFCLSFCHSVNRITVLTNAKTDVDQTWQACATGDCLEVSNFWLVVIRIRVWIPDHFFIFFTIAEYGIFGHLLVFLIQSTADLYSYTVLGEMTDADKAIHSQLFGTDLAGIRIRINPKILIRIPDHFILALAKVCALWVLLSNVERYGLIGGKLWW